MLSALSSSGWPIRQRMPASRLRGFMRCRVRTRVNPLSKSSRKHSDEEYRSNTDQHNPCPVYPASPRIRSALLPSEQRQLAGAGKGDQHVKYRCIEARDPEAGRQVAKESQPGGEQVIPTPRRLSLAVGQRGTLLRRALFRPPAECIIDAAHEEEVADEPGF